MTVKKTAKKTSLQIGKIVTAPPAPPRPPKSDTDRIVEALEEIESTLSHRLEMIEDNINYLGQSIGTGLDGIERAIRNEARPEE